jgi:DNA-binding transcriptional LysR family regulator
MNKFLAIRAFISVVERGGFTAAGEELGMSVSSVTKMIARLEENLSTRLLNRTTRQVTLTDFGREYYGRCQRVLSELDEADEIVRDASGAPKGRLRVLLPNSFGRVTLVPALPEFFERYPEVSLELDFGDDMQGLLTQQYDVVIGKASLDNSRLVTRVLVNVKQIVVASPHYLEAHGRPKTPEDLIDHKCIIGNEGNIWRFQGLSGEEFSMPVGGPLTVLNGDALREAAVCGLGLSQGTWFLYRKDLETGRLVSVLDDYACDSDPVRVVFRDSKHLARKVRVFLDFLVEITKPKFAHH